MSKLNRYADLIESKKSEISAVLSEYETQSTIEYEIEHTISGLQESKRELENNQFIEAKLTVSTFFPLNLPLYSLLLFAIIPSAYAEKVFVRTPKVMSETFQRLIDIIELESWFPEIVMLDVERSFFLNSYASLSDVVLFTGRYENALVVEQACLSSLFIYNGSGINPLVVTSEANIGFAASKSYEMRVFNSGQDCAGPDAIFVDEVVIDEYIDLLTSEIKSKGSCSIGNIMKSSYLDDLRDYLWSNQSYIREKGSITGSRVEPYILVRKIKDLDSKYHEFFAPVFNIIVYSSIEEVNSVARKDSFIDKTMYVSVFGRNKMLEKSLEGKATVLIDKVVNDVEKSYKPYGGFGCKANYVAVCGERIARPLLISAEISNYFTSYSLLPADSVDSRELVK